MHKPPCRARPKRPNLITTILHTLSFFSSHQNRQEFCHVHSIDRSWHVLLSAADALEVLAKGWGERGPPQAVMGMAPVGMMLVYAPRNEEERLVFLDILAASSRYCEDAEGPPPEGAPGGGKVLAQ